MTVATAYLLAGAMGATLCTGTVFLRLRATDARRTRTNWRGRPVRAVLGDGLVAGALGGLAVLLWAGGTRLVPARMSAALAIVGVVMYTAGLWDDLRGAERARGFSGHLRALQGGGITGGIVKLVAGGLAGLAAGWLLAEGDVRRVAETALLVALTANGVNLLDRAPGRALKVSAAVAVPLLVWGPQAWSLAATGMGAALLVCLPFDLRERAMLGDAGANPIGAVLGVGLAVGLSESGRIVALILLAAVNLASERISFSAVIERNKVLAWLDGIGRA
ncbi:MAG TPA: hypothetical protein VHJ82_07805 [Actinomycetota bacterium]|nr:hypothetical protein [Actinomycetota bacterium]